MKTLVIKEYGDYIIPDSQCFDLEKSDIQDCIGCWTCWWKTPGVCIHADLKNFYRQYVNADKVIIFAKLEHGFISVRLKRLLDRMIPLFLPYTIFAKGGTWHSPRYPKYPSVTLFYDDDFQNEEDASIFYDYIQKVFEQFYAKEIHIHPISDWRKTEL